MKSILIDTCFWYALFDPRDAYHEKANELVELLDLGKTIIPFPTLYETFNTRFSKNKNWVESFENILQSNNVEYIEDLNYKEDALSMTFDSTLNKNRPLSLVDMIIRLMLDDDNLKVDYLITFNTGDFVDICHKRRIELIDK
jgi:predicted nucleic acid-binding protein